MSRPEEGLVTATSAAASRALAEPNIGEARTVAFGINAVVKIENDEHAKAITDAAKVCAAAKKSLEDQLKSITGPLRQAEKAARELAAPSIETFERAIARAKDLYRTYDDEKKAAARKAQEEQQRLEREAAAKREQEKNEDDDDQPAPTVYVPPTESLVRGQVGGMTMRKDKKYRVTNLADAVMNHPELFRIELRINETKAALARLRASDPDARLVGIEEYEDETPTLA